MVKRVISLLLGQALADGGFNASLRDWGWLGLLLAHDGKAGMEQVVPLHNLLTSVWESIGGEQNPQPYEERDALWPGVLQSLGGDLIPY